MNQIGTVKRIDGKKAVISIKRPSACGENCAGCTLSCDVKVVDVAIDTIEGIKVGDKVEITSENVNIFKLSVILYGLPLAILVLTIAITSFLFKGEYQLLSGILGLASLIVSSKLLKMYEKKVEKNKGPVFKILGKVDEADE